MYVLYNKKKADLQHRRRFYRHDAKNVPTLTSISVLFLYNMQKRCRRYFMRVDKFLNSVNITKRRSVSQDMIANGVVLINGVVAKASKSVAVGDIITINYLSSAKKYKVLQIPQTKSTPKSLQEEYIKEIS